MYYPQQAMIQPLCKYLKSSTHKEKKEDKKKHL